MFVAKAVSLSDEDMWWLFTAKAVPFQAKPAFAGYNPAQAGSGLKGNGLYSATCDYLDMSGTVSPACHSERSEESRFIVTLRCFAHAQHDKISWFPCHSERSEESQTPSTSFRMTNTLKS
ncbi:hypothetical protein HRbin16_01793 [bacterium HR16]|nr:hypothetical protein HRbin16_01793 [bacterium HR16]